MKSSLVVTSAATSTDLTVRATVKEELGIPAEVTQHDSYLTKAIRRASGIVAEYCGQTFAQETVTETFWPDRAPGFTEYSTSLLLSRLPVVSIGSLTVDDSVKDASEYRINSKTGELTALSSGGPSTFGVGVSAVVVYTAGYLLLDGLPDGVEDATLMLIRDAWFARARDPRVRSESIPGVASYDYWVGQIGAAGQLPPDVLARLEKHRRLVLA